MARPSKLPAWGTDTNYTNGPDAGTATKTEPSAGEMAEGHIRGTAPSAQKQNWWQNNVGAWVEYFDDYIYETPLEMVELSFTGATGTFTTEANCSPFAIVEGCGGGGNGGDGGDSDTSADSRSQGGGGGGGAPYVCRPIAISASTQYDVVVGSAGNASTIAVHGGATIVECPSGQPGVSGNDTGGTSVTYVSGGDSIAQRTTTPPLVTANGEAAGGAGCTNNGVPQGGFGHRNGYQGGQPGGNGTDDGTYRGGGAGGGGGAGPFGDGAAGATGGAGNSSGAGVDGNGGSNAAANTGAGGGGGGGAGHGSSAVGNASSGGIGGSGRVRVIYWRPKTP